MSFFKLIHNPSLDAPANPKAWRTNNKIALCQSCHGVLTPDQDQTCNNTCRQRRNDLQASRPDREKIWVYLNKNMLDILKSYKVVPHEFSYLLFSGHELILVAVYDREDIQDAIGDREACAYDAWWREIGGLNISLEPHQPEVMREEGILSYLCDYHGISTEKNVAAAIGDLTALECLNSPVELFNTL